MIREVGESLPPDVASGISSADGDWSTLREDEGNPESGVVVLHSIKPPGKGDKWLSNKVERRAPYKLGKVKKEDRRPHALQSAMLHKETK